MISQLLSTAPIFASRDFDVTAAFYANFGYRKVWRYAEGYLILRRDGVELHFYQAGPDYDPAACESGAYVRFLNVAQLTKDWSGLDLPDTGIPRYVPPKLRPWGMFEAHTVDPDGNLLTYGTANEALPETT